VSRETASRWYEAWRTHGAAGLRGAGRAGRKPRLDAAALQRLEVALVRGPTEWWFPTHLWTLQRIVTVIWKVCNARSGSGEARCLGYHQGVQARFLPAPYQPDGGISPVRLEEQVLAGSLPDPPWSEPRSATSLLPPTAMRCVITELQPLRAGRVSPHRPRSQGPFAPTACYHRHLCSYGPMRQSSAHRRTSRYTVIAPASRAEDLPRFDHTPFGCCRHPYAGRPGACMCPISSAPTLAIARNR